MLGLLVIIIISWMLLRIVEKKNIEILGIIPYPRRILQFLIGVIVIMLVTLLNIYFETIVLNVDWELKSTINYKSIFEAFIYHIRSALTEDLVFRGALLYILISRLGARWAILISALFFGVYHVFSYGMTAARIIPILYVILVTGFTGYVWAFTFHKTKSIMMGLGLHLGVNFINACFFESQPFGELFFQKISSIDLRDWHWLYFNLFKGLFPSIMTLLLVKQYLNYKNKYLKEKENL